MSIYRNANARGKSTTIINHVEFSLGQERCAYLATVAASPASFRLVARSSSDPFDPSDLSDAERTGPDRTDRRHGRIGSFRSDGWMDHARRMTRGKAGKRARIFAFSFSLSLSLSLSLPGVSLLGLSFPGFDRIQSAFARARTWRETAQTTLIDLDGRQRLARCARCAYNVHDAHSTKCQRENAR